MPLVYRAMPKADDGLPAVEPRGLGVRPDEVDVGPDGLVVCNAKGMSVVPNWRDLNIRRIPKRLRHLVAGAAGSNAFGCFRYGDGPFQAGQFAPGLTLVPDEPAHATVAPEQPTLMNDYLSALAATRPGWQIDES